MEETLLCPDRLSGNTEFFYNGIRDRIIGQQEAIQAVLECYQTFGAGMSVGDRPVGNFLFLGPTGTGKTRMVEATAEVLMGDPRAVIKIDCGEYQHSHEIAKLIGSPPGYLGHRETHALLSQQALDQYHTEKLKLSLVLFDEIEKASDALWNLLLGILDKATLTLGDNRRVDFSCALIFMTSNLGAAEMAASARPSMGFSSGSLDQAHTTRRTNQESAVNAARKKFLPEFMNRIDRTVVFNPLFREDLKKILELEVRMVQQRVFTATATTAPFVFYLMSVAKDFLLCEGTDMKYGARHLKRAIERHLVRPLSSLMATEQVRGGDLIRVGFNPETSSLVFFREQRDMPCHAMVQWTNAAIPLRAKKAKG